MNTGKETIKYINPKLQKKWFNYKIFICWWGLDEDKYKNTDSIIYTGFISDIEKYIKGCDIMINPILSGWGVKTKVIESLACWKTIISTIKWAEWVVLDVTEWKLITVENNDWHSFVGEIIKSSNKKDFVSESFLEEYEWSNIISNLKL